MNNKKQDQEIGRYRKKISDQEKKIKMLESDLASAQGGMLEMQMMVDTLLSTITIHHGEKVTDPETGDLLGWRLNVPIFDVGQVKKDYEIHASKDFEKGTYTLGVVPRKN